MNPPPSFEVRKQWYEEFRRNPPEDAWKRYYKEYRFMEDFITYCRNNGQEEEVAAYEAIMEEDIRQLKALGCRFGDAP